MSEQVFCSRASALPQLVYLNKQIITGHKDYKKRNFWGFKDRKKEIKKDGKLKERKRKIHKNIKIEGLKFWMIKRKGDKRKKI